MDKEKHSCVYHKEWGWKHPFNWPRESSRAMWNEER